MVDMICHTSPKKIKKTRKLKNLPVKLSPAHPAVAYLDLENSIKDFMRLKGVEEKIVKKYSLLRNELGRFGNDSAYLFDVRKECPPMQGPDACLIADTDPKNPEFPCLDYFLNWMCHEGFIPVGEIFIIICW